MKNCYQQWDLNLGPSAYEAKSLSIVLLDEISIARKNMAAVSSGILRITLALMRDNPIASIRSCGNEVLKCNELLK